MMRRVPLVFGLLALGPSVLAQQASQIRLGVSVSAYYFTDSTLRNALGDPAVTYGVDLASLTRPQENKLSFAYNVITASKGDSTLFLLPFTAGYEKQFANRSTAKTVPYARIEAGVSYYDVALHDSDIDRSFKSYGFVGAAEVGIVFNKNLGIKARYNLFQQRSGLDFSGAEIGLAYSFGGF